MNQLNQTNLAADQSKCCSLAIAHIPMQEWNTTYDLTTALCEGTIFPELNLPFYLGGKEYGK